jgi:dTDP-4-amino-4,6-dideoxygalactose transaminase
MIPVAKPYLPSREKLNQYLDGIYERNWQTNNGPLVQELTSRLEEYLGGREPYCWYQMARWHCKLPIVPLALTSQ